MTYTFQIDKSARLVRETWTGTVTLAELQESSRAEWAHPDYSPGFSVISDFRLAVADITADEVLRFASWFSGEDTPRRHAIIIAKQSGLDMAGIFSMIRDSIGDEQKETQLFFSPAAAETWISQA
jgi:hypothetical protein